MYCRPLAIAALLLACLAPSARAALVVYDPGLGLLPQPTGWTYEDQSPAAQPVVTGGVLSPHATGVAGLRWWHREDSRFSFTPGFRMEVRLDVTSADYVSNVGDGTQRSGFYVDAIDSLGRRLTLGVATAGVTLNTNATLTPSNGIPLTAFSGTGTHDFLVTVVAGDSAVLVIDGARAGATPVGLVCEPPNSIYFGDGTQAAGSDMGIHFVQYGNPATTAVSEGSSRGEGALRIGALGFARDRGVDLAVTGGRGGSARLRVLDLSGRRVADLGDVHVGAAGVRVHWPATDASGRAVEPGVYFVVAEGSAGHASGRAIVLR